VLAFAVAAVFVASVAESQLQFEVLHSFPGSTPIAPAALLRASDGNLYGIAAGTVFKSTPAGVVSVLYRFAHSIAPSTLIQGTDGNLYGTTPYTIYGNATFF